MSKQFDRTVKKMGDNVESIVGKGRKKSKSAIKSMGDEVESITGASMHK